jgi:hypothetical protein
MPAFGVLNTHKIKRAYHHGELSKHSFVGVLGCIRIVLGDVLKFLIANVDFACAGIIVYHPASLTKFHCLLDTNHTAIWFFEICWLG